uniref:Uncharacterized protein n=1 Tax=Romanomermis culicivorax TaxID=13658 RepID=A0A915KL33_ROMCU
MRTTLSGDSCSHKPSEATTKNLSSSERQNLKKFSETTEREHTQSGAERRKKFRYTDLFNELIGRLYSQQKAIVAYFYQKSLGERNKKYRETLPYMKRSIPLWGSSQLGVHPNMSTLRESQLETENN